MSATPSRSQNSIRAASSAQIVACLLWTIVALGCEGAPEADHTTVAHGPVTTSVTMREDQTQRVGDAEPADPNSSDDISLAELLLGNDQGAGAPTIIPEPDVETPKISDSLLEEFGLRSIRGKHLTLITDLGQAAEVDELPMAFDKAVPQWSRYFKVDESETVGWHQTGYLMKDRGLFVRAGLLPDELPKFLHGYHAGDQLWVLEQPSAYYRRHLVLHEGVHGFMKQTLGGTGPPWYREGMAELLATHRWANGELEIGVVPTSRDEVPEWGRIKLIRDEFAAGKGLMLRNIAGLGDEDFLDVESYAWSWGACAYLDGHPRYHEPFRALRGQVNLPAMQFNQAFDEAVKGELRELDEQWQLFVMGADYGYDFARNAVVYNEGKSLPIAGARITVETNRGWQSSGYRLLAGRRYLITAQGRYQILQSADSWMCEPNGITLRYYAGKPLGLLVGNVRLDEASADVTNLGTPIPIGLRRRVDPVESGVLYLKVNDHPGELVDNVGTIDVQVVELD